MIKGETTNSLESWLLKVYSSMDGNIPRPSGPCKAGMASNTWPGYTMLRVLV